MPGTVGASLRKVIMASGLLLVGLAVVLAGAMILALADAWLSHSILKYLDAIESNLGKLAESFRAGDTQPRLTSIDRKRDRGQDRARGLKLFGWVIMIVGFGLQLAATWIATHR